MIELQHLSRSYDGRPALRDVSAVFPQGGFTCLVGPNGCGKTTLLKLIANIETPDSGAALCDGQDVRAWPRRRLAQRVAYLPQTRPVPLLAAQTMIEHGRFPYLGFAKTLSPADHAAVAQAVAATDTAALIDAALPALSGGERQRVFLAAAVAQETAYLLLDEPTTYLDTHFQIEILTLVRRLHQSGKTVLMVAHDLPQAFAYADTICVMQAGRLLCQAAPQELCNSDLLRRVFGYTLKRNPDAAAVYPYYLHR